MANNKVANRADKAVPSKVAADSRSLVNSSNNRDAKAVSRAADSKAEVRAASMIADV